MPEQSTPHIPDPDPDLTRESQPSETTGVTIGPYQLLQKIGEGGMGEVWMAEQARPMRRLVAVKIIKAGMDTARVVARFEAERQALALMEHPVIATVFDGGATAEGRPYFAMEYVKGEPITRYCDRHRLSMTENGSGSSCGCAKAFSTHTRRGSSIATSSLQTSWSRSQTECRSRRSSTSAWPRPSRST